MEGQCLARGVVPGGSVGRGFRVSGNREARATEVTASVQGIRGERSSFCKSSAAETQGEQRSRQFRSRNV